MHSILISLGQVERFVTYKEETSIISFEIGIWKPH